MHSDDVKRRILEIITEFETTRIKDRRIVLTEENIKMMVGDHGEEFFDAQFSNCLNALKGRGLIELHHKCGEPRWRLARDVTE